MRKISEKWRRLWRKIWIFLGISSASLVFQGGYSMMQSEWFSGTVRSGTTNEPLSNIRVTIRDANEKNGPDGMEILTNDSGMFSYRLPQMYGDLIFILELEDDAENRDKFQNKRVIHRMQDGRTIEIILDEK